MTGSNRSIFILLSILMNTAFCQPGNIPSYNVCLAADSIIIDGKIDEPSWDNAGLIKDFMNNSDNTLSPYKTEAKILYNNEYLFFAFRVIDDNIWSTKTRRDDHLWEEEVVEVFLRPNLNEPSYIELELNPLGAIFDAYMLDSATFLPFDSWNITNLMWAVQVQGTVDGQPGDDEWTCEIAFPLVNAVTAPSIPPKTGDTWYVNLYRAELKPEFALISWSPTYRDDFHIPGFFGKITFTGK